MSATESAAQDLKVIDFDRDNFCEQSQSPLFSVLPGEIRDRIFAYALAEFEDDSVAFGNNTCYRRPEYAAPRRSDTALLRTCQRIYQESFFYPFALAEQTFFLAWPSRRPERITTIEKIRPSLALINKLHGETELDSVRVYAQLCSLEPGRTLGEILSIPHFLPRTITITIRHTDIWEWESDTPIHIGGQWTVLCRFPDSLRCLKVQVESLERRKDQVDFAVSQMIRRWRFKRRDDTFLCANNSSTSITRWSGSSTWEGERWIRDETRPETLDYYVATVAFRPVAREDVHPIFALDSLQLGPTPGAVSMRHPRPFVTEAALREANVPPGLSADEVLAHFDEHRREQAARTAQAMEAARQRHLRQQATRSSRQAARRARAQAEIASAYPHQAAAGSQPQPISADNLRSARAARRAAANRAETASVGDMDWFENPFDRSGTGRGRNSGSNTRAALDLDPATHVNDDAGEGSHAG